MKTILFGYGFVPHPIVGFLIEDSPTEYEQRRINAEGIFDNYTMKWFSLEVVDLPEVSP